MTTSRRAVLLMAYGGPNSLEDVEPYLLDVRGGRPTPPELVEQVRHRYAAIGGRSPLLEITLSQARALEERLNREGADPRYRVYVGMRHWHPYIRETVARIVQDGFRDVVAICMAPQYSRMSVGAYFQRLAEAQEALGARLNVSRVEDWHDHPLLVQAFGQKVVSALRTFGEDAQSRVHLVFSAHSLPSAIVEQGDPYADQVQETARLVAERVIFPPERWRVSYQSAGALQARWLGPRLEDVIVELAESGQREILVAPIGFVADHVEILYDVEVEARWVAERAGAHLERIESLNAAPLLVEALFDLVRQAMA